MQFSVIVEGPMDSSGGSEDDLMELERFLAASNISTKLLHELKKGEPKLIKNELTYEQAVTISDRLMEVGLDSIIDPPIKPDDDDEPEMQVEINTGAKPKTKVKAPANVTPIGKHKASQKQATKNIRPNASNAEIIQRTTPIKRKAKPAKSALPVQKLAKGSNQQNTHLVKPSTQAPKISPTKSIKKPLSSDIPKGASETEKTKASKPNSELAKAAAEVKAIFNLPENGFQKPATPKFLRAQYIGAAIFTCGIPALYGAVWLAVIYLTFAMSGALFSVLGSLFLPIKLLLAVIPIATVLGIFALTHLPMVFNWRREAPIVNLRAADETKLFMLATAFSKLLNVPAITRINLKTGSDVSAHQTASIKEFFSLKQPIYSELNVSIGSNLGQCIPINGLCGLIAKECGIYSEENLRRPLFLINANKKLISKLVDPANPVARYCRRYSKQSKINFLSNCAIKTAIASEHLHQLALKYFDRSSKLLQKTLNQLESVNLEYEAQIAGQGVANKVESLQALVEQQQTVAHYQMLDKPQKRLVESLPELCVYLIDKHNGSDYLNFSELNDKTAIINSNQPLKEFASNWEKYTKALTLLEYQYAGIDISSQTVCPIQQLFQHQKTDEKVNQAACDYFGKWQHPLQFWRLPAEHQYPNPNDTDTIINRLNNCIARIRFLSPDRPTAAHNFDKLLQACAELRAAKKVTATGNEFVYKRCADSKKILDQDLKSRTIQTKELLDDLRQHNGVMGERLALGLLLCKKPVSSKILRSAQTIHSIGDKAVQLAAMIEELGHLIRHKPKNQIQQHHLYVREMVEKASELNRVIIKRLAQCPYDYVDKRYQFLSLFIEAEQENNLSSAGNREENVILESRNLLAALNWGFKQINERAAFVGLAMEKQFNVDTVKVLH